MKMIPFFLGLLITLSGCSNHQSSSHEEARYVMEHQEDFAAEIFLERVDSGLALGIFLGPGEPYLYEALRDADPRNLPALHLSYIAIYETTEGKKKLLLLKDSRPPKVVLEKVLEVEKGSSEQEEVPE